MRNIYCELGPGDIIELNGEEIKIDRRVETHSSVVFLSQSFAIKAKKDVNLGFLDYSSRELRRVAVEEEFRLGRQISPSVYLKNDELYSEPVILMRRLDDSRRFDRIVNSTSDSMAVVKQVARACVTLHESANPYPDSVEDALRDACWAWNVNQLELEGMFEAFAWLRNAFEPVRRETDSWLSGAQPQIRSRAAEGRFVECHGDLRLEHVYFEDQICFIDPLEFSRRLRFSDVAADVCFLAMELFEMEKEELGKLLISEYAKRSNDSGLLEMAPFYIRYRAVVRGKVECIRALQIANSSDSQTHEARAAHLFEVAARTPLIWR